MKNKEQAARVEQESARVAGVPDHGIGARGGQPVGLPRVNMPGKGLAQMNHGPGAQRQTCQHDPQPRPGHGSPREAVGIPIKHRLQDARYLGQLDGPQDLHGRASVLSRALVQCLKRRLVHQRQDAHHPEHVQLGRPPQSVVPQHHESGVEATEHQAVDQLVDHAADSEPRIVVGSSSNAFNAIPMRCKSNPSTRK